jgi:hypothetical protein
MSQEVERRKSITKKERFVNAKKWINNKKPLDLAVF